MAKKKVSRDLFDPYHHVGTGNLSIEKFLDAIKVEFNYWLYRNDDYYPECCTTASQVLYGYLSHYYPNLKILYGNYTMSKNPLHQGTHCWISDNTNRRVDFTVFQFFTRGKLGIFPTINAKRLYETCIERFQGNVYIRPSDKPIALGYDPIGECDIVKPEYQTLGDEPFFEYVYRIQYLKKFINRHDIKLKFFDK